MHDVGVRNQAGHEDPLAHTAFLGDALIVGPTGPIAHEQQAQLGIARGDLGEGAHEPIHALIVLEHADIGDKARAGRFIAGFERSQPRRVDAGGIEEGKIDKIIEHACAGLADAGPDRLREPLIGGKDVRAAAQETRSEELEGSACPRPVRDHPIVHEFGHEGTVQIRHHWNARASARQVSARASPSKVWA